MNKRVILTMGIGLAVLFLAALFATATFAQGPGGSFDGRITDGWGRQGFGPGMMSRQGFGGAFESGCPMFGPLANPTNAQPISIDQAAQAVQQYLRSYNNPQLALAEVMEFENNLYAVVKDQSTGTGAFEVLVDRYAGVVTPEPGPNMMWNTTCGHMSGFDGMMGGRFGDFGAAQQGSLTVSVAQARRLAQAWLDANMPGARLADDETQFPGYYTMDFLKDGKVAGMLSVNGYSGQVWYHTWHGNFIAEKEF
jgi:hypothetical protein